MKILLLFFFLAFCALRSEDNCAGRYELPVFGDVRIESDIEYGHNVDFKGEEQRLLLDFYEPAGDTATARPLVLMLHGGAFRTGDKEAERFAVWGRELARRGYAAASVNYRLGIAQPVTVFTAVDAAVRALQDAKAAVRFFRRYAAVYRIDTSQIFALGTSAGSYTALNLAYLQADEVPFFIDVDKVGGLEGTSGNPGFSSAVHGVVNMWGALLDSGWVEPADVPVMNIHGVLDTVVPYNNGVFNGVPQYGSLAIFQRAQNLGLYSDTLLFYGVGHQLDNDTLLLDSAFSASLRFLYSILDCNSIPTGVSPGMSVPPLSFSVDPNPLIAESTVRFIVPSPQVVHIALYDALGRRCAVLYEGKAEAGAHALSLGAVRNTLSPGPYYCRISCETGWHTIAVSVQ